MATDAYISTEYAQIKEKWYNNHIRASEELSELDVNKFSDINTYLAKEMQLKAEIRVWKEAIEDLDLYFKPDAIQKSTKA